MRSTSLALSLAPKATDALIASATPQAITDKCFVFILFLLFRSWFRKQRSKPLISNRIYVMAGTKKALHEPTWVPHGKKMGVGEKFLDRQARSLQPLSQVCVA
jgi:hypothetical protein